MKTKNVIFTLFALILAVSFLPMSAFGQERKIKMNEYNTMVAGYQQREAAAKAKLEQCNTDKTALQNDITALEESIKSEWNEIYKMIGTDAAGVEAYRQSLNQLESQVDGLSSLSSEELFQKRDELKDIESKLEEHKANRIYALSEMQDKVATIEGKLTLVKNRMPKSVYDDYNVVKGDYLWKISKKSEIYDDPMQWMKIYTYNRDMIKNPDLIYPDWVFKIPRKVGPNEYIVVKGEFLSKIASNPDVLVNPTEWTKLYEANKEIISDPNTIYPYQILVIPRN